VEDCVAPSDIAHQAEELLVCELLDNVSGPLFIHRDGGLGGDLGVQGVEVDLGVGAAGEEAPDVFLEFGLALAEGGGRSSSRC